MNLLILMFVAVIIDYLIGDPASWPHPIIYIGRLIKAVEKGIRKLGLDNRWGSLLLWLTTVSVVTIVMTIILGIATMIHSYVASILILYFLFASMAATCLKVEVMKVASALDKGDLSQARRMLGYLVGRDTADLSEEEIIKATVETTAENTIDGVLAPLFYMAIGVALNCPVQMVFLYKTVNTLDSMVGYIQEPYTRIGYVSAKMDDLFNFIPARIGSLFMLVAGGVLGEDLHRGARIFRRDRKNHKSPNAGYPEAVIAGLLGICLGGTHTYFGQILEKPTIGDAMRPVVTEDIMKTVKIMYVAEFMLLVIVLAILMMI